MQNVIFYKKTCDSNHESYYNTLLTIISLHQFSKYDMINATKAAAEFLLRSA